MGDGHVPGGKVEGIACVLKESAFLNCLSSINVLSYFLKQAYSDVLLGNVYSSKVVDVSNS